MDANKYKSDAYGIWDNADPSKPATSDMMPHDAENDLRFLRWVSSELLRMEHEEQDRTRTDSCPECGAYWEDAHYEECPMLICVARKDAE